MPPRARLAGGRVWAIVAVTVVVLIALAIVGLVWVQAAFLSDVPPIPDREALWAVRRSPGMTFLDHNGVLIATRGAKYGARVSLADLPAYAPRAFLAAEDRRFYQHGAVDPLAILRAARRDVTVGRAAEGASTLSQQLARTLFLKPDHTLKRKIQESVLASRLEDMLGKDQVLALYLNRTYFGAGAYGLDAAAQTYFGEHAGALTLAQVATLAALPNAPSRLTNDLPAAWARARRVLAIMRGEGWITEAAETEALANPPTLTRTRPGEGGYSYILDQAATEAGALAAGATDLVVRLTIDPRLQAAGQEAVRAVVAEQGRGRNVSQGALVALAPDGAIRAMIGGMDHNASAYNRVTQARRQPGSSFKAFVFGAALERGVLPTDTRQDAPIALAGWTPGNYGGHYSGAVTLQQALARSINTVSVRLALETSPDQVGAFARRCGLKDIPAHPGPSIALGAYEVTLLELAGGYQVFQTGGGRTTPYLIESLANTNGEVLFSHLAAPRVAVFDPLYATRLVGMLKTVISGGTGTGANIGRPAAGKTGTSQNWRDAWFVGFTPDLLAGVWVGNDNNRPMNKVTGGELPAQIWKRFMSVAEKDVPPTDFAWLVGEPALAPDASANAVVTSDDGAYQDQPPAMEADNAPPPADKPTMAPESDPPDPGVAREPTPTPDNPP
jgi:penicillin-binding protein 1A